MIIDTCQLETDVLNHTNKGVPKYLNKYSKKSMHCKYFTFMVWRKKVMRKDCKVNCKYFIFYSVSAFRAATFTKNRKKDLYSSRYKL